LRAELRARCAVVTELRVVERHSHEFIERQEAVAAIDLGGDARAQGRALLLGAAHDE
jgi:hypothetical protein